ncbi:MAG: SWIM zinc finger family protein [Chloroflexota bacterium]|nr:SWIM zinc finger family protein [Chloroflexota bacterium]
MPSQRYPGRYYLTTQSSCTCEDARRQVSPLCKHALAVQIHIARVAGKPMPASDLVDGLARMVSDRHLVLEMVREEDGSIRWERPSRPSLPAATIALAEQYIRIFGRD